MTWDQYWYGDVWMASIYREADKRRMERKNAESHLLGMYMYEALCDVSPILQAFSKKEQSLFRIVQNHTPCLKKTKLMKAAKKKRQTG